MEIKKVFEIFANNAEPGTYLTMTVEAGGELRFKRQDHVTDCGPLTDRELVGLKRMDGTVVYFGRFKDYDNKTNN
jgi:hypothetical protein